ncbi:MAG: alpha/beta hydrolase [Pseudomonadota bacterium]
MRAFRRLIAILLGGLAALLLLSAVLIAIYWTPDIPYATLEARYGGPSPRYAENPNGPRIYFRDEGIADAPAVFLLHGSNDSHNVWDTWAETLGRDLRVIRLDWPGHGLTGPHPKHDYGVAAMNASIDAVAAALGLERFALVGHSMGGGLAWRYAARNPDRVTALLLVDATGPRNPETSSEEPKSVKKRKPPLGFRIATLPVIQWIATKVTPRGLIGSSLRSSVADPEMITDQQVDRYWELLRAPGNRIATVKKFTQIEEQPDPDLGTISAPTLIMWGADDQLIPPRVAELFDEKIKNTKLIIYEDIGHIPQLETPEQSARDAAQFLMRQ